MDLNAIGAANESAATFQAPNSNLDKDAFMQLLVSQMQNQDPLEPQTGADFVAQLAGFSELEEVQALNENLLGLAVLQQENALLSQMAQSSGLIGHEVRFMDPETLTQRTGTVGSVRIENGLAMLGVGGDSVPLANVMEVLGEAAPVPMTDGDAGASSGSDEGEAKTTGEEA